MSSNVEDAIHRLRQVDARGHVLAGIQWQEVAPWKSSVSELLARERRRSIEGLRQARRLRRHVRALIWRTRLEWLRAAMHRVWVWLSTPIGDQRHDEG